MSDQDLHAALAAAEQEAAAPVVPGELEPWWRSVAERLADLEQTWERTRTQRAAETRRILAEDPGLARRVEMLRENDAELAERLQRLRAGGDRLRREDLQQPTASEEALGAIQAVRRNVLGWVVDARAFDAEMRTWVVEAAYRDRGVVD